MTKDSSNKKDSQVKTYITDLSDFKPDPENANKHKLRGRSMVHKGMEQRGYARPAFSANDGTVLGGNLSTMDVAADIGLGDGKVLVVETDGTIPIIHKRTDIQPGSEQARLLAIEDNRSGELSIDWDIEQLDIFKGEGLDLTQLWNDQEWAELLEAAGDDWLNGTGTAPEPQDQPELIDKAEELQKVWQVKAGDVWQIGPHRLICGDCRNPDDIAKLLQGQKLAGCFTSPPYAEQRKKQYGGVPTGEYVQWWEAVQANVRANLASDGSFFVNIKPHCEDGQRVLYVFDLVCEMVRGWGWKLVDEFCWQRGGVPGSWPNRFKNGFEPVYHFSASSNCKFLPRNVAIDGAGTKTNSVSSNTGGYYNVEGTINWDFSLPTNSLDIKGTTQGLGQAAAFPVALPSFFVKAYSDPGDSWLDPFAGSGTVGVAANNEGRVAFMSEILPKYCSVILERMKGHAPRLVSG